MEIRNKKLDEEAFLTEHREVISGWPTGEKIDLTEAIEYHINLPLSKNFANCLEMFKDRTLIHPRGGYALLEQQKEAMLFFQNKGLADLLPVTVDTYTRNGRFEDAEKGLQESIKTGRSVLNGFPIVNYGVDSCRELVESVDRPISLRTASPDIRMVVEVAVAGGISCISGGHIGNVLPFSRDFPLKHAFRCYQFLDRLLSYYAEHDVIITRKMGSYLTGTLVAPGIALAVMTIECLLSAEQGVKSLSPGYCQGGNIIQDLASLELLPQLCNSYLLEKGYQDCRVTTEFHQWMSAFPLDNYRALGVICLGAATAALGGASWVMVKSYDEAHGVPSKESSAESCRASKQVVAMLQGQRYPRSADLDLEKDFIEREARAIIDKVYELGDGDLASGAIKAIKAGVIDIPYAPHVENANRVLTAKDSRGAVRFIDCGNLPFDNDIREYHKEKLSLEQKTEDEIAEMVINAIYSIADPFDGKKKFAEKMEC
jgi:methylaspartate mutase epsilon subunit